MLLPIEGIESHYQIVVDRVGALDVIEIHVEVAESFPFDEVKELEKLAKHIRKELESALLISIGVKLVEPRSIARSEGKAKRVIDNRKL